MRNETLQEQEMAEKPRRGRPPKDAAVLAPAEPTPELLPALAELEAIGRAPAEQAARDLAAFRARLRAAYQPVPAVLEQLRALETLYLPELRRLATLPLHTYRAQLGSESITTALEKRVDGLLALLVGKAYPEYTLASVLQQLEQAGASIERLTLADQERADELVEQCRRAPEWPAVLVDGMAHVRDLSARLVEVLRRRGDGATVATLHDSRAPGISVVTPTGDPRPVPRPVAESGFDPLA